jgi:hypothetical protein
MRTGFEKFSGILKYIEFVVVSKGVNDVIKIAALAEEKLGKYDNRRKVVNLGLFVLGRVPSLILV